MFHTPSRRTCTVVDAVFCMDPFSLNLIETHAKTAHRSLVRSLNAVPLSVACRSAFCCCCEVMIFILFHIRHKGVHARLWTRSFALIAFLWMLSKYMQRPHVDSLSTISENWQLPLCAQAHSRTVEVCASALPPAGGALCHTIRGLWRTYFGSKSSYDNLSLDLGTR